jgi:transposase
MGRSRGGLTTKIHAIVDAGGRPIGIDLTAGQTHDSRMAELMLKDVGQGAIILADRAYNTDALRAFVKEKHAWATTQLIPAVGVRVSHGFGIMDVRREIEGLAAFAQVFCA